MMQAEQLKWASELAEAAYFNFGSIPLGAFLAGEDLKQAMKADANSEILQGWPDSRIADFVAHWRVVDHIEDALDNFRSIPPGAIDGLSVTVFERILTDGSNSPQYFYVPRGTNGLRDLSEDFGNIVADGLAWEQIVGMYNHWKRISAARDSPSEQADITRVPFASGATIEDAGFLDLPSFYKVSVTSGGQLGEGRIPPGANVTVVGHSLGGHLATAFSRLFSDRTMEVLTLNGAGYGSGVDPRRQTNIDSLFAALGGAPAWPAAKTTALHGSAGWNVVTMDTDWWPGLKQPASQHALYTESPRFENVWGHGVAQMTSSAAVVDLLVRLEGTGGEHSVVDAAQRYGSLLGYGADDRLRDLEEIVESIHWVFGGTELPIATGDARDFYGAITRLAGTGTGPGVLTDFAGQVQVGADFDGPSDAEDFAGLLSLLHGSPLTFDVQSSEAQARLGAVHTDVFTAWSSDLAARRAGASSMDLRFTDAWLSSRADFLNARGMVNSAEGTWPQDHLYTWAWGSTAHLFDDRASGRQLFVAPSAAPAPLSIHVFGAKGGDVALGAEGADRLFGMAGKDRLDGQAGMDWLEGGAGLDTLLGGAGSDVLLGGEDADELDGGAGLDQLRGGDGVDRYLLAQGHGMDEIEDTDGAGVLVLAGYEAGLPAFRKVSDGVWRSVDGQLVITQSTQAGQVGSQLVISRPGRSDRVLIRNWQPGELGIELTATLEPGPVTTRTFTGDQRAPIIGVDRVQRPGEVWHNYDWAATSWSPSGALSGGLAQPGFSDVVTEYAQAALSGADRIDGLAGNDALDGGPGSDRIDGGSGSDLLTGGAGGDWIWGGSESDFISSGNTLAVPRQVNADTPPMTAPPGETYIVGGDTWLLTSAGIYGQAETGDFADGAPDVVWAGSGDDTVQGGHGADLLHGDAGVDGIYGLGGDDVLVGGADADFLNGDGTVLANRVQTTPIAWHGHDVLDGGAGHDTLQGAGGHDVLLGGEGDDQLVGDVELQLGYTAGEDLLDGGLGNDWLYGGGGHDRLRGGEGADYLGGDFSSDPLSAQGADVLAGDSGNDTLSGGGGGDLIHGGVDNDLIYGDSSSFAPELHGADLILAEDGDDLGFAGGGGDTVDGGAGNDYLLGDNWLEALAGEYHRSDVMHGGLGQDTLFGGGGVDALYGGAGDDWLSGEDQLRSDATTLLTGGDWLDGGDGNDILVGGEGADTLIGGSGTNRLYGGAGRDVYRFSHRDFRSESSGGQLAVATWATGATTPAPLGGVGALGPAGQPDDAPDGAPWAPRPTAPDDAVGPGAQAALAEHLVLDSDGGSVFEFDAVLTVADTNSDADLTLAYGVGSDTQSLRIAQAYFRPDQEVVLGEEVTALEEWVQSRVFQQLFLYMAPVGATYAFGAAGHDGLYGSERADVMLGGLGNDGLHGEEGDDRLEGQEGDDRLEGDAGADTLTGGLGNDLLYVGDGDAVHYRLGDGVDTVSGSAGPGGGATLYLGEGLTREALVVQRAFESGNRNDPSDLLIGWSGIEGQVRLSGHLSNLPPDSTWAVQQLVLADGSVVRLEELAELALSGGPGDDQMYAYGSGSAVSGNGGNDTLSGSVGVDTLSGGDGNDTLYGAEAGVQQADVLDGGAGEDRLEGGAGDQLLGGKGDDVLDGTLSSALLDGGEGNDTFESLSAEAGSPVVSVVLKGGAGNDQFRGWYLPDDFSGRLKVDGGSGNDVYWDVDSLKLQFGVGDGRDLVKYQSPRSFDTPAVVDLDAGISVTQVRFRMAHNDLWVEVGSGFADGILFDDYLYAMTREEAPPLSRVLLATGEVLDPDAGITMGTSANDVFSGTSGHDFYLGGYGNDSISGSSGDDALNGGLGSDTLHGGQGNDSLSGGAGVTDWDRLAGGAGDDSYYVTGGYATTELAGEGTDSVFFDPGFSSGARYVLQANVEHLKIEEARYGEYSFDGVGNGLNNRVEGNSVVNLLDGGQGADTLVGLGGDDVYLVDSALDTVIEQAAHGTDTVRANLSWALGQNLEHLELLGPAVEGTGNELDNNLVGSDLANRLSGLSGNDTLSGGLGNDTLAGGLGDDVYLVVELGDVLVEDKKAGIDTVRTSINWTLGDQFENLELTAASATQGTGNGLNNLIQGNSGADTLKGLGGNDSLSGGKGNDKLQGGGGADQYRFQRGWGRDTVIENDGTAGVEDSADFAAGGIAGADVSFVRKGNNLEVRLDGGSTDVLVVRDWYLGAAYQVEQFHFVDGSISDDEINAVTSLQQVSPSRLGPRLPQDRAWSMVAPHQRLVQAWAGFSSDPLLDLHRSPWAMGGSRLLGGVDVGEMALHRGDPLAPTWAGF